MLKKSKGKQGSMLDWCSNIDSTKGSTLFQLRLDHNLYLTRGLECAGPKVKAELKRIVSMVQQLDTRVVPMNNEEKDLIKMLNKLSLNQLSTYVKLQVEELNAARTNLERRRSQGTHRISTKTQNFVLEFDRFLTAYSGIVSIITLMDGQQGGVACATLSFLFSTVKSKIKEEEAITSAMQQISDRLPDFRVYERIYPDPELGPMLVDAYRHVVLLAREATSYFTGSSLKRQMYNFGKPLLFETMGQEMQTSFIRVRFRCEVLLAQRVERLTNELEEAQKRTDSSIIIKLRSALQLGKYHPKDAVQELEQHRKVLAFIFDEDRVRTKLCIADFLAHEEGRYWQENSSCLFMLSGHNEDGVGLVKESWLSPVAVDLILTLLRENQRVIFDICDRSSTLKTAFSRLIFQLLERNPATVRKGQDCYDIQEDINRCETEDDEEKQVDALFGALLKIIKLQEKPVFIVLDRPDLSEDSSVTEFALTMLHQVEEVESSLKMLIVYKAELWDWEANKRGIIKKDTDPEKCRVLRFDQCRL